MSEKKPETITSDEADRKRKQERFGMTPDNTMIIGLDGKPKPWVVPVEPTKNK